MNSNGLEKVEIAAGAFLAKEVNPTPDRIRFVIGFCRALSVDVDDDAAEALARRFEARHGVTMMLGATLTDEDYAPWLASAKSQIEPYYWERYKEHLENRSFSSRVIATLDQVTDRILGLLENPRNAGSWDRRGMVVGHVQSGKTANYTGLMCKAADAGYRLIIVIAGVHNSLRNQTQARVDEGFVGRDSARLLSKGGLAERVVGVGKIDRTRFPVTFTNTIRDFNKATATSVGVALDNLNEPAVFVIKKNASTLKNLLDWLREYSATGPTGTTDTPVLLIDDEADNASINIRHGKQEVARINGQIRSLLNLFDRSGYVGYTATPFANIFIDPATDDEMFRADLFPRNFIVSLDPPTNYFGAQRVFVDDADRVIRHIDDNHDCLPMQHQIDFTVTALPETLVEALRTFVLACGIRRLRGQGNEHSSMLVNVSRFTGVQTQMRSEIHQQLAGIQRSVRIHGAKGCPEAERDPEIAALQATWEREYSALDETWAAVLGELDEAGGPIEVVEINSRSSGALNYAGHLESGRSVIAVGGYSLSRGLTLEGLVVSYFMRNSMMYDTLLQMARWFGYREGYDELCRVWMPEEVEGRYAHVAESVEMLRDEIRLMEQASASPKDFGLKVRSHPDSLEVVARNKMGSGKRAIVRVGLGNQFVETATLRRGSALSKNREAATRLGADLHRLPTGPARATGPGPSGWLATGVPVEVVRAFLASFQNDPRSLITQTGPILDYVDVRACGELAMWDVFLPSLAKPEPGAFDCGSIFGLPIVCQRRTAGNRTDRVSIYISNKQRVASRGVERVGLSADQQADVEAKYRELNANGSATGSLNYPDRIYREKRFKPLLIVHLLQVTAHNPEQPTNPSKADELLSPIVAWGISFPRTRLDEEQVEYVVNAKWLEENRFDDDRDDEEDDPDA